MKILTALALTCLFIGGLVFVITVLIFLGGVPASQFDTIYRTITISGIVTFVGLVLTLIRGMIVLHRHENPEGNGIEIQNLRALSEE